MVLTMMMFIIFITVIIAIMGLQLKILLAIMNKIWWLTAFQYIHFYKYYHYRHYNCYRHYHHYYHNSNVYYYYVIIFSSSNSSSGGSNSDIIIIIITIIVNVIIIIMRKQMRAIMKKNGICLKCLHRPMSVFAPLHIEVNYGLGPNQSQLLLQIPPRDDVPFALPLLHFYASPDNRSLRERQSTKLIGRVL